MLLLEKQKLFPMLLVKLFNYTYASGYEITLGEAWRSTNTAKLDAKDGIGISNSLHILRLAIDLNLFKAGLWLTKQSDFEPIGIFWENLSNSDIQCCWGGRFGDADHFSISHNGIK